MPYEQKLDVIILPVFYKLSKKANNIIKDKLQILNPATFNDRNCIGLVFDAMSEI